MYSANTIVKVYLAPKDAYSFQNLRNTYKIIKRRWKVADVFGADEIRVLENNRRHYINYKRPLKIFGWFSTNSRYEKVETFYQDIVGDIFYPYVKKFTSYLLDWWGVGGKFLKSKKKAARNTRSIPNTPMFNPGMNFDNASPMEKIYLEGWDYEDAIRVPQRGHSANNLSDLVASMKEYNMNVEGMDDETAYNEALRIAELVGRNLALKKNNVADNEYAFVVNYYNRFIDENLRSMMKLDMNIWFLKETMKNCPNLSFYVMGPYNKLMRIQGIVGERQENVIIKMENFKKQGTKYKFEYVYSVGKDTLINESRRGFIKAKDLEMKKSNIANLMYGNVHLDVDHRYTSEYMYDLILEGKMEGSKYIWVDAFHNTFLSPDYSNPKNLIGKEIIC